MVQWFSPGFLACTQGFKTRLTNGILLGADMGWGVLDESCAAGLILSQTWILLFVIAICHWTSTLKSYNTQFSCLYAKTYKFLHRIHGVVDARELNRERVLTYRKILVRAKKQISALFRDSLGRPILFWKPSMCWFQKWRSPEPTNLLRREIPQNYHFWWNNCTF